MLRDCQVEMTIGIPNSFFASYTCPMMLLFIPYSMRSDLNCSKGYCGNDDEIVSCGIAFKQGFHYVCYDKRFT